MALASVVRCLLFLVGVLAMSCAATAPNRAGVVSMPEARLVWLEAELARAEQLTKVMRGAYVPRSTPGAAIHCSLAIQIDAWYGASDEKWELTNAANKVNDEDAAMPTSLPKNMREELSRIGIRDCILAPNR